MPGGARPISLRGLAKESNGAAVPLLLIVVRPEFAVPLGIIRSQMAQDRVDPLRFTARWRVRSYELDANGHVNNAVYLNWAEEIATEHAEAAGYGRDFSQGHGGGWIIRRSDITHHLPAVYNDLVDVEVRVEWIRGARAVRRTWIRRSADNALLAEVMTEWVWIRLADGRPAAVPKALVDLAASVTARARAVDAHRRRT